MLAVISPSKNLDFKNPINTRKRTDPVFLDSAANLVGDLRELSPAKLSKLMNINDDLSELNAQRYQAWTPNRRNARQALLAFRGDVYWGLEAWTYTEAQLTQAQRRLRILSGLYGVLKPLDVIHPYRLEMGLPFRNHAGADLYAYWGEKITKQLNEDLAQQSNPILVNLASDEYFKSIRLEALDFPVISCSFLDNFRGQYRFMSYYGKKARGLMAKHIVLNKVNTVKALKAFDLAGYRFSKSRSSKERLTFVRDEIPSQ